MSIEDEIEYNRLRALIDAIRSKPRGLVGYGTKDALIADLEASRTAVLYKSKCRPRKYVGWGRQETDARVQPNE
jgi:hypothetical protein